MKYMTCNLALIDVDLAIYQCQDQLMHNRKDCKWNICTSVEHKYKLLFLCWRRIRNCILYSDVTVHKGMKYFAYQKTFKLFLGWYHCVLLTVNQKGMTFILRDSARMRVILKYTNEHQNFHLWILIKFCICSAAVNSHVSRLGRCNYHTAHLF
jgi:hypothetical protein